MSQPFPYLQIADDLRDQIAVGHLAQGDRLPSENELARRYATTRTTVRKALALLRSEGHLVSEQGRGVFVRPRPDVHMVGTGSRYAERRKTGITNFNAETAAQGHTANQVILGIDRVAADPKVADRLGVSEGTPLVVRRRRFEVDGHPMQLVDGYYLASLAEGTALMGEQRIQGGAHAELEGPKLRKRLSRFVEELELRMPSPSESEELLVPRGVPVAQVTRTAYDAGGEAVEVLVSVVPGDRHRFVYEIDLPE